MQVILVSIAVVVLCVWWVVWVKGKQDQRRLERHSISPEALQTMLTSDQDVLLYDVRQPLDLLVDSEIIPGAKRIPPKELMENPDLIPKEREAVVYWYGPGTWLTE